MTDEHGKPLGTRRLLEVAQGRDPTLVVAALQALGEGRDPSALATLAALVLDPTPWRAVAAVEALAGFDSEARAIGLARAFAHEESEVVKAALGVLSHDDALTESLVIQCLGHNAWDVRRMAADLLGRSSTSLVRGALKAHLTVEREPLVVEAIRRSLSNFESSSSFLSIPPHARESET
jgi:HEAT repeat protein